MEIFFSLSRMASETFGRPSAKRSPFHSEVMALIYSCDDPTFWADASAQARASRIREKVFLFIGFFFLKIITISSKNKIS